MHHEKIVKYIRKTRKKHIKGGSEAATMGDTPRQSEDLLNLKQMDDTPHQSEDPLKLIPMGDTPTRNDRLSEDSFLNLLDPPSHPPEGLIPVVSREGYSSSPFGRRFIKKPESTGPCVCLSTESVEDIIDGVDESVKRVVEKAIERKLENVILAKPQPTIPTLTERIYASYKDTTPFTMDFDVINQILFDYHHKNNPLYALFAILLENFDILSIFNFFDKLKKINENNDPLEPKVAQLPAGRQLMGLHQIGYLEKLYNSKNDEENLILRITPHIPKDMKPNEFFKLYGNGPHSAVATFLNNKQKMKELDIKLSPVYPYIKNASLDDAKIVEQRFAKIMGYNSKLQNLNMSLIDPNAAVEARQAAGASKIAEAEAKEAELQGGRRAADARTIAADAKALEISKRAIEAAAGLNLKSYSIPMLQFIEVAMENMYHIEQIFQANYIDGMQITEIKDQYTVLCFLILSYLHSFFCIFPTVNPDGEKILILPFLLDTKLHINMLLLNSEINELKRKTINLNSPSLFFAETHFDFGITTTQVTSSFLGIARRIHPNVNFNQFDSAENTLLDAAFARDAAKNVLDTALARQAKANAAADADADATAVERALSDATAAVEAARLALAAAVEALAEKETQIPDPPEDNPRILKTFGDYIIHHLMKRRKHPIYFLDEGNILLRFEYTPIYGYNITYIKKEYMLETDAQKAERGAEKADNGIRKPKRVRDRSEQDEEGEDRSEQDEEGGDRHMENQAAAAEEGGGGGFAPIDFNAPGVRLGSGYSVFMGSNPAAAEEGGDRMQVNKERESLLAEMFKAIIEEIKTLKSRYIDTVSSTNIKLLIGLIDDLNDKIKSYKGKGKGSKGNFRDLYYDQLNDANDPAYMVIHLTAKERNIFENKIDLILDAAFDV